MNIGFIAHESKKKLLQNFCIAYRGILSKHQLYATGTSGRLIEEATNLDVHKLHAGHVGGEQQMASMIEQNQMDLVIFLCGPYQEKKQMCIRDRSGACFQRAVLFDHTGRQW